jgi:hypothetical protein
MLAQLFEELRALWREARPRLAAARAAALAGLRALWSLVRPPLLAVLQITAALVVLFEEWGWRPLVEALGRLARFRPWAALELWIAGLPPYGALAVFALPTTILLPLKFVAMWLLAKGQVLAAGGLFVGAKLASTALIARIFILTKPALMQIGWFARAYSWFTPWKEALFAEIRASWAWRYGRMVKTRTKLEAKRVWTRWQPRLQELWHTWQPWTREQALRLRAGLRGFWLQAKPRLLEEARRLRINARRAWARVSGN